MSKRNVNVRYVLKNDTSGNWKENNPILLEAEMGVETDTGNIKMGDGVNQWTHLLYVYKRHLTDTESALIEQIRTWYSDIYLPQSIANTKAYLEWEAVWDSTYKASEFEYDDKYLKPQYQNYKEIKDALNKELFNKQKQIDNLINELHPRPTNIQYLDWVHLVLHSSAYFTLYNPILEENEIGIELDTHNFKVGDGETAWNDLDYDFIYVPETNEEENNLEEN